MKNIVRVFALAVVATGAVASMHASNNTTSVAVANNAKMPIPSCPPNTPDGCGIDKPQW